MNQANVGITGVVLGVIDLKTRKSGKSYKLVQVQQSGLDGRVSVVDVRCWNGIKLEVGKVATIPCLAGVFNGQNGQALLSLDSF